MKRTANWRKVCLGWALAALLLAGVVGPNPALAAEASLGGLVGMYEYGAERLLRTVEEVRSEAREMRETLERCTRGIEQLGEAAGDKVTLMHMTRDLARR